jgi:ketosteroid isomerase-like protein
VSSLGLVRAAYDAFERGDREGALTAFAEGVEWHQAQGLPHGGVYVGLTAVRHHVFDPLSDWWEAFSAAPTEFIDAGATVVVLGRYTGRARAGGAELDVPFVHVWTMLGGRCVRFRQFLDTHGWVEALRPQL